MYFHKTLFIYIILCPVNNKIIHNTYVYVLTYTLFYYNTMNLLYHSYSNSTLVVYFVFMVSVHNFETKNILGQVHDYVSETNFNRVHSLLQYNVKSVHFKGLVILTLKLKDVK